MDFRGFDSSIILILRDGILMSIGESPVKFDSSKLSRRNVSRRIERTNIAGARTQRTNEASRGSPADASERAVTPSRQTNNIYIYIYIFQPLTFKHHLSLYFQKYNSISLLFVNATISFDGFSPKTLRVLLERSATLSRLTPGHPSRAREIHLIMY